MTPNPEPPVDPNALLATRREPNGHRLCKAALAVALLVCLTQNDAESANRRRTPKTAPTLHVDYSARDDVRRFVQTMAGNHQFSESLLLGKFERIRRDASIIRLMEPPGPTFKRSWAVYRERFLDPLRQREGARFWRENEAAVRKASEQYGVPPEIIVSIIGVETIYGRVTGDFRVIDALTVLGFDYPRRAEYFRSELEQFLLFTRENDIDPLTVRGSFAGAIGLPQFMPGSIRRFAVDFDGDGRIDLRGSATDAIGSVAKFLADHGWVRDQPTHFPLRFDDEQRLSPLIASGIEPQYTRGELAAFGIQPAASLPDDLPVALIDLPNGDSATSYYLGGRNFYVITRYNRSSFYAMAVIELANLLRENRQPAAQASSAALARGAAQPGKSPVDR